jgi:hypothetical protein
MKLDSYVEILFLPFKARDSTIEIIYTLLQSTNSTSTTLHTHIMKPSNLVFLFLPLIALANPMPEPAAEPAAEPQPIEKRAVTCPLTGSNVRYHTRPDQNSPAPGEFGAKGTNVPFACYTIGTFYQGDKYVVTALYEIAVN